MVSNLEIEMRKEEQEKKETILKTDSGDENELEIIPAVRRTILKELGKKSLQL